MGWKGSERFLIVGGVVFAALLGAYGSLESSLREWAGGSDPNRVAQILVEHRVGLMLLLTAVVLLCQAGAYLARKVVEGAARQKIAEMVCTYLHRRSWPGTAGRGVDPTYRVSLVIPLGPFARLRSVSRVLAEFRIAQAHAIFPKLAERRLYALFRTDGKLPTHAWKCDPNPSYDGVAGYVFAQRTSIEVEANRANETDENAIKKYCSESFMQVDQYKNRSWEGCAITGVPVQLYASDEPVAVLIIERQAQEEGQCKVRLTKHLYTDASLVGEMLRSFQ